MKNNETRILGKVYFVQDNHSKAIKIGKTSNFQKRLNALKNMPYGIKVINVLPSYDYHELEKEFHKFFKTKRLNGEWFNLTNEDIEKVKNRSFTKKIESYIVTEENVEEKYMDRQRKVIWNEINEINTKITW